jgi:hypothetical protein
MCLLRLRVLAILAVPAILLAQHASTSTATTTHTATSTPSASSPSHSTASTASSSSSASHTTSSSASHSTSASSPSHSPSGISSTTHNSTTSERNSSVSRTRISPTARKTDPEFGKKSGSEFKKAKNLPSASLAPPEKGSRFAFWRKRRITPVITPVITPAPTIPPDLGKRKCRKEHCACPPGETRKGGACVAEPIAQTHPCGIGQAWNGIQCVPEGCPAGKRWNGILCAYDSCPAGERRVGAGDTCRADCTTDSARAQDVIMRLRTARIEKDDACRQDPYGLPCQQAEASYSSLLNEYRNFLGSVPIECRTTIPDPISI